MAKHIFTRNTWKKRLIMSAINLICATIKDNYYFIALKRDVKAAISAAKSDGDFVMQANKVAVANFSRTLREEPA